MIYLCAGLFAEGKTDYELLLPLISRVLDDIGARVCPGAYDVAPSIGIDAPAAPHERRADRIACAVSDYWEQCTLFVVHADSSGDAERARAERVEPGLMAARATALEPLAAAACIPVRETEAWMLVDPAVFEELGARDVELPAEPERVLDPKAVLVATLEKAHIRRPPSRFFAFFGERLSLDRLRTLQSFGAFEREVEAAVRTLLHSAP